MVYIPRRRAPIEWRNHDHFLAVTSYALPKEFEKETKSHPDLVGRRIFRILRFKLDGKNICRSPLTIQHAELRVLGSLERFPVEINEKVLGAGMSLAPNAPFSLTATFPNVVTDLAAQGMPIRQFYETYPYLVLCVKTDRGTFTQEFTPEDTKQYLLGRLASEWGETRDRPTADPKG